MMFCTMAPQQQQFHREADAWAMTIRVIDRDLDLHVPSSNEQPSLDHVQAISRFLEAFEMHLRTGRHALRHGVRICTLQDHELSPSVLERVRKNPSEVFPAPDDSGEFQPYALESLGTPDVVDMLFTFEDETWQFTYVAFVVRFENERVTHVTWRYV